MKNFLLFIMIFTILIPAQAAMNETLQNRIKKFESEQLLIPADRKAELELLSEALATQLRKNKKSSVTFICTHNSRRSQLGQALLQVLSMHLGIAGIRTYSGGTETTAFNIRMVNAMKEAGFVIKNKQEGNNPVYQVGIADGVFLDGDYYSKKFTDPANPSKKFIAVMVCGEADEACPLVPGAAHRISLPYVDPRLQDGTVNESKAYQDKIDEMGRELFYVLLMVKNQLGIHR